LENLIAAGVDPASQKFIELQTNLNNLKAPNLDAIFKQVQDSLEKADVKIRVGLETDTTSEKINILENALTGLVDKGLEGTSTFAALQTQLGLLNEQAAITNEGLSGVTLNLGSVFEGIGTSLGELFSGDGGAEQFFGNIISIVGAFTESFGKQLIAYGVASEAFQKTLAVPGGGIAAIAAGVALVAIGGAIKNKFAKGIPSLDIGTRRVQSDGLALIHKGEEIKPARVVGGGNYDRNNTSGRSVSVIRGNDLYLIGQQTAMLRKRMAG
jgi:hypothetical protein